MDDTRLAQRLRAFRKLKGYTQQQLADVLEISVSILGSVERATRHPDPELLRQICDILNIRYEELMSE
jgi:transcriptional regulator with XRE-family HTH domain